MMRERIGYPNPTLRKGVLTKPWNTRVTADAVRRLAESTGDMNPLYNNEDYAAKTRWGQPLAQPGFEWSIGIDRSPVVPADLNARTHKALRGVQLFHSGAEYKYYRPLLEGTKLYKSEVLASATEKTSRFGSRSVIVDNATQWWDDSDQVYISSSRWFVHVERKSKEEREQSSSGAAPKPKDEPAHYSDEDLAQIEAAYDAEYIRGANTLYIEDVKAGDTLPTMVKGPLTITDMINIQMGTGWMTYGNPRIAWPTRTESACAASTRAMSLTPGIRCSACTGIPASRIRWGAAHLRHRPNALHDAVPLRVELRRRRCLHPSHPIRAAQL